MPDITFTLTSAHLARLVTAYTVTRGYSSTLPDGTPNPETQQQFTKRVIGQDIKFVVKDYENAVAIAALVPPTDITLT